MMVYCRIQMMVRNPNNGAESKWWCRIQMMVQNPNDGAESKWWWRIQMMVRNPNDGAESKWWCGIQMMVRNPNDGAESKWWCTNQMMVHKPMMVYKPNDGTARIQMMVQKQKLTYVQITEVRNVKDINLVISLDYDLWQKFIYFRR